ncbi:MAG: glycosyltransferase [Acidobacteria bacterium]|nr:glycosyltransferase [Acidobacteriota bacterium]
MRAKPRVALFTDSYLEVNGVARTSREFTAFSNRNSLPLLCIHAAPQTGRIEEGSLTRLGLKRTPVGFKIEEDQRFDLLLWRHLELTVETVREFKPDLIHITGPSDVGLLGAYVAHQLRLPRVLSWHTNLHEYAGRRLSKLAAFIPRFARGPIIDYVERQCLRLLFEYYKIGQVLFAPNRELGEMLERNCARHVFGMRRGVDTELFSPVKRLRRDSVFTLGYVGRIAPEKNVRQLVEIEKALIASGMTNFRFVIVGVGSEREWLEKNLQFAEFTGVLKGESLARAYANFDLFIFPSSTDTFGNVVLEAQASGVPAIVSDGGGPKFIISDGETGYVARDIAGFRDSIMKLISHPEKLQQMREAARMLACATSWDKIFEEVYRAYDYSLRLNEMRQAIPAHVGPAITTSDVIN